MSENKKSIIPFLFVAFILTFVAIDAIYIYVAQSTYSGVYTKDHYQKGVDFARANSSGLVSHENEVDLKTQINGSNIEFEVQKNGEMFYFDDVKVKAIRPVNSNEDTDIKIINRDVEGFSVNLSDLKDGQWEIRIKVSKSGQDFFNKFRLIKNNEKVRIKKPVSSL